VTAYDQHAIHAFERGALDYLLKPVDPQRLAITIGRLPATRSGSDGAEDRIICLESRSGYRIVRIHDIACVRAQGDYTLVQLRDGSEELVALSLQSWIARLPADSFGRVHRSAVVRLDLVEHVEPRGSAWVANVRHVGPVDVSRGYLKELRDRFRLK
jgi:DNA-binding LytR/AlgR family response regulator